MLLSRARKLRGDVFSLPNQNLLGDTESFKRALDSQENCWRQCLFVIWCQFFYPSQIPLRYLSDPITVPSQSQHVDHWLLWNGNTHQKVGESCCSPHFSAEGLQMHMWSIRWGSCANRSFALSAWHRFSASEARRSGQTMLRGSVGLLSSVILLTSLVAITTVQTERCRWSHVNLKFASEKQRANNNSSAY